MSLIKTEKYKEAYDVANEFLVSDEFKPILAQTVLLYNSKSKNSSVLNYLNSKREPAFYEYLADSLNNEELLFNASLLWAQKGDIEKAYTLLRNKKNNFMQEAVALFAYDTGRDTEALSRLLDLPKSDSIKKYNNLLIADIFYLQDNFPRSKHYYEKALSINSENPYAYINISTIYKLQSKFKKATETLNNGIDIFREKVYNLNLEIVDSRANFSNETDPVKKDLTKRLIHKQELELRDLKYSYRELVLLYYSINKLHNQDSAIRVLQEFRSVFPDDVKIELLLMKNIDSKTSPDIFEAKMWKLLNEDNDNKDVSEYLIWYYLGIENYNNVNLILERAINRYPENSWTSYYLAILNGLKGNFKESLEHFNVNNLSIPQWEVLYNRGVIEMALVKYEEALELFNKSLLSLENNNLMENRNIYKSQVKTKIAEVLLNQNNIDEAIRELNNAYELDPSNYRSDLLKSIHLNIKEIE